MEKNTVHPGRWQPRTRTRAVEPSPPAHDAPAISPTDPRWVLAIKTAEALQGPVLPLEHRDRLIRLGRSIGLTAFDSNLIIAIVQDQARRGHQPEACPAEGIRQLTMVSPPRERKSSRLAFVASLLMLLTLEAAALFWFFQ